MKRHTWVERMVFGLVLSLLTPLGLAPVWAQPRFVGTCSSTRMFEAKSFAIS